ncbi:hypothetical protein ElyMa_005369100 [Elysia marginata]|uniref:Adipocyte plasma membrane-associated protein n=1 Tax=Elysia marginata TaxID=1093978 RepID=A0AAV4ECY4_9GAST|nr:hypothetical protein ElyMa_005369100 [Elysia marginata]
MGDICVSDPRNSTLIILDSNLSFKESIKFPLPSCLSPYVLSALERKKATDSDIVFRPEGVCYDRYGRIIVADPNANMVVRLSKSVDGQKYELESLISKADCHEPEYFRFPKLVAFGEDGRLWVVCHEYVLVFDYGI